MRDLFNEQTMQNKKLLPAAIVFALTAYTISQAAYAQTTPQLPNEGTVDYGIPRVKDAIQTVTDTFTVIGETFTGYPEAFRKMYLAPWW
jgi:hypothetical protein